MTRTNRHRGARTATLLVALATATSLMSAAPAMADNAQASRESLSKLAAQAQASSKAVPQEANRPLPQAAGQRGVQAVTASNVFYDGIGDNSLAPDLRQMVPFTSDDGRYSVAMTLDSNGLIEGDFVSTFVNTDGNPATGETVFGGADVAVWIIGHTGQDGVATSVWNGASFQAASFPSLISFPSGVTDEVWSISAAELGIGPGATTTLVFGTEYSGFNNYFDFAPEPGLAPFSFTAGSLSPPPPPPVAPVTPAPVPPSPLTVRSFVLSKTPSAIRVRMGWVKGDGRVTWQLRLSARVNGRSVTKLVRGAGQAGSRTITRTVRLPESWAGAKISARLEVHNGSRTITRNRSIRF
jgi:hypothetical protein